MTLGPKEMFCEGELNAGFCNLRKGNESVAKASVGLTRSTIVKGQQTQVGVKVCEKWTVLYRTGLLNGMR